MLRDRAGPGTAVFPVVKADAYGHGAVPVARRLADAGAERFAVAIAEEGVALRRAGLRGEILLLNFCEPADAAIHHAYGLTPTIYSFEQARGFAEAAKALPAPLPVHLKIDTGMWRLGFRPPELAEIADLLKHSAGLALRGTFTHLSSAEEPDSPATNSQIEVMQSCLDSLRAAGVDPGLVHLSNSAGLLAHPAARFDAVRPGLALYGIRPSEELEEAGLVPAMTVETHVMSVKRVPPGTAIGYGGTFVTARPSTIAVLPIGYHDGLRRSYSGRVSVLLRGRQAPVVGAVGMDLTLVDATDSGAKPGDRAVLLGKDGGLSVTAWDLAHAAGTIPYEILCGIGTRVPRAYLA